TDLTSTASISSSKFYLLGDRYRCFTMSPSLLFTSSCIRIYFSPSGHLLISTFPGFWPSSFATFSARLVDAEPASIIIGETEARGWDLIKAEPYQAKVLGFARVP